MGDQEAPKKETDGEKTRNAVRRLAETPDGELFLRYLCKTCGVFNLNAPMMATGLDSAGTIYNEGRRSIYVGAVRPLIKGSIALPKIENLEV